jgi:hypothetical protein
MSRAIHLILETTEGLEHKRKGNGIYLDKKTGFSSMDEDYADTVKETLEDLGVAYTTEYDETRKGKVYVISQTEDGDRLEIPVNLRELYYENGGTVGRYWIGTTATDIAYGLPSVTTSQGKTISKVELLGNIFMRLAQNTNFWDSVINFDVEGNYSEITVHAYRGIVNVIYGDNTITTIDMRDDIYDDDKVYRLFLANEKKVEEKRDDRGGRSSGEDRMVVA